MNRTMDFYDKHAAEVAATYEDVEFAGVLEQVCAFLPQSGRLLELGAGSGRDAAFWMARGYDVTAVDGSSEMVNEALRYHPELAGRVFQHRLPVQLPFRDASFNVVVSMAVIMHLPAADISMIFAEMSRVLRPGGICAYSVNTERSGLDESNFDQRGRRFTCLPAEQWEALHTTAGLVTVYRWENKDITGRNGIRWVTAVCRKEQLE